MNKEIRNALAKVRDNKNDPRRHAARVLVQNLDEIKMHPESADAVRAQLVGNSKRFQDPTLSPDSFPMRTAREIAERLGLTDNVAD